MMHIAEPQCKERISHWALVLLAIFVVCGATATASGSDISVDAQYSSCVQNFVDCGCNCMCLSRLLHLISDPPDRDS